MSKGTSKEQEQHERHTSARRFHLYLEGLTPLLMNSADSMALKPANLKGPEAVQWEREHLKEMAWLTADKTRVSIPARAIHKMAMRACSFISDKPRGTPFKSFLPLVEVAILVEDDAAIDTATPDKLVAFERIVNLDPSKGPRGPKGLRARPLLPLPWRAQTTMIVVDALLTVEILERIFDTGGRLVGLGERALGHGRCLITIEEIG